MCRTGYPKLPPPRKKNGANYKGSKLAVTSNVVFGNNSGSDRPQPELDPCTWIAGSRVTLVR